MSKYYAVRKGVQTGIFRSWTETEPLVKGFKGAQYKSFRTEQEAKMYLTGSSSSVVNKTNNNPNNNELIIYTDGSCVDKIGGYGYVVLLGSNYIPVNGKVPYYPTTNQVAELYAIWQAINWRNIHQPSKSLIIYTDSKYSIGCLTEWHYSWIKNGWKNSKGEPVANKELIKFILSTMTNNNKTDIKFVHVRAHNGDYYNEMADRLANEGR